MPQHRVGCVRAWGSKPSHILANEPPGGGAMRGGGGAGGRGPGGVAWVAWALRVEGRKGSGGPCRPDTGASGQEGEFVVKARRVGATSHVLPTSSLSLAPPRPKKDTPHTMTSLSHPPPSGPAAARDCTHPAPQPPSSESRSPLRTARQEGSPTPAPRPAPRTNAPESGLLLPPPPYRFSESPLLSSPVFSSPCLHQRGGTAAARLSRSHPGPRRTRPLRAPR